ncbi:hypothetical protein AB0N05_20345 [Nocardia sp. NPDC051030]|uniref:hypothetical protein n=1 Tax=Nocardia sp. NPDC051030 TaxID=3155162 RepID=UPI00341E8C19
MESARTALREHLRRGLLGSLIVAMACLGGACDSAVGIPRDDTGSDDSPGSSTASATTAPGPADAATVAVGRWAADLREHGLSGMENRCWTIAPKHVRATYADPQPIFDALAQPGVHTGDLTVWKNGPVAVVAQDRDVASGYACPQVYSGWPELSFDDADARHTVRRYLSRLIGKPLDARDTEAEYPLVCSAAAGNWDPDGTGKSVVPPLATNPGRQVAVTAFVDQSINSEWPRGSYITVSVPVTTGSGKQVKQTFTLKSGGEGYCIGDVSG